MKKTLGGIMSIMYYFVKLGKWVAKQFDVSQPGNLGVNDCERWHIFIKKKKPIAYFFGHTIPDWFNDKGDEFTQWLKRLKYKHVDRTHLLTTDLEPGYYYSAYTCTLHGVFKVIVDFVEVELAKEFLTNQFFDSVELSVPRPSDHEMQQFDFRCKEAGIAYLTTYECGPVNKETYDLYNWWTVIRPQRQHEENRLGVAYFWDKCAMIYGPGWHFRDIPHRSFHQDDHNFDNLLADKEATREDDCDNEDEEMLIRAVKHLRYI